MTRYLANGSGLDSGYGTSGSRSFSYTPQGVVELTSQKHLVVGLTSTYSSNGSTFLARVNADGTFDSGFGSGGYSVLDFFTGQAGASWSTPEVLLMAAEQGNGKVVVTGYVRVTSSEYRLLVARVTTTGALDTTFSDDGYLLYNIPNTTTDQPVGIAIDNSGDLLISGGGTDFWTLKVKGN